MTRHRPHKFGFVSPAFALLLAIAATAFATVPPMEVTVFDAGGKVAFKGPMSANATFATPNLRPGNYVIQFNTKSAAVKDDHYLLVVSAGKKKVIADAVAGEKFTAGGVAMKIDVVRGLKITGQVANEQTVTQGARSKYRVIDGKRFVWVGAETGSNLRGRWVEEGLPQARNVISLSSDDLRRRQDRSGEGSMIPHNHHHLDPPPGG